MTAPFRHRKLGYVALTVSDLGVSAPFYEHVVGLNPTGVEGGAAFFRCSDDHHDIVLYEGAAPGLKRVGWELESADELERAFAHFDALRLSPVALSEADSQALHQGRSFRVRIPHCGAEFEYFARMEPAEADYTSPHTKIVRLGHVVLGVAEFEPMRAFAVENLAFATSDVIDNMLAFFRCFPNPLHHSFAIGNADKNKLSHVNFMVTDIDDIGRALHRLGREGVRIAFGPGRHPPSDSVFLYFLDPDGLTLEYSFGMEEFPEAGARPPRLMERAPASLDSWGARPTPEFGATGVIEGSG